MGDFIFPAEAGLRVGAGAISHVILEIHYDNPKVEAGVADFMGFEVCTQLIYTYASFPRAALMPPCASFPPPPPAAPNAPVALHCLCCQSLPHTQMNSQVDCVSTRTGWLSIHIRRLTMSTRREPTTPL